MKQDPQPSPQEPVAAGTIHWTVQPETEQQRMARAMRQANEARLNNFTRDSDDEHRIAPDYVPEQNPETFRDWHRENRRDLRDSIFNGGRSNDGDSFLESLARFAIGQGIRKGADNCDPYEDMAARQRGEETCSARERWER